MYMVLHDAVHVLCIGDAVGFTLDSAMVVQIVQCQSAL